MGMMFRVFTEDVNRPKIEAIAGKFFPAFTMMPAQGIWNGQKENSLVIEVIGDKNLEEPVNLMAQEIKLANRQESVLVQRLLNSNWLV